MQILRSDWDWLSYSNTIKQLDYELEISTAHRNRERII